MVAAVEKRPQFRVGLPKLLFTLSNVSSYDIMPDGQRFVAVHTPGPTPQPLSVIVDWFEEVKRRAGAEKKVQ
jgi:hypothetical protein